MPHEFRKRSSREDGRGHWPRGKRRSDLTDHEYKRAIAALKRGVEDHGSAKSVARQLRKSDRTIRRLLSGEDWPSRETAKKILASL